MNISGYLIDFLNYRVESIDNNIAIDNWEFAFSSHANTGYNTRIKCSNVYRRYSRLGGIENYIKYHIILKLDKTGNVCFQKFIVPKSSTNNTAIRVEVLEKLTDYFKFLKGGGMMANLNNFWIERNEGEVIALHFEWSNDRNNRIEVTGNTPDLVIDALLEACRLLANEQIEGLI